MSVVATSAPSQTIDLALARQYFQEAATICNRDNGRLWGVSLSGPMLFADPGSREVVANQSDREGRLAPKDDVFVGKLPKEINIANTATSWAGVSWTMIAWPLPEDAHERGILMAHELWHRVQKDLGLPMTSPPNGHLDSMEGRIWLQLEWRTLEKALQTSGSERRRAVGDALTFRAYRRQLFSSAASEENALELNEGLAEDTGIRLGCASLDDEVTTAFSRIEHAKDRPSFVRSFAYVSGPAYGILLDEAAPAWRKNLKPGDDLGTLLAAAMAVQIPNDLKSTALERSKSYRGDELRVAESAREAVRQKALAEYRTRFVEGPVLKIPLRNMHIQFNPNELIPIPGLGTVYPTLRISDVWGVLTASKGALLAGDWSNVTVAAPTSLNGSKLEGGGWTLELTNGWTAVHGARQGDWLLQEQR